MIVALGSNLAGEYPSSRELLEAAIARMPGLGLRVTHRSRWWRSASWPDPTAPDYLNGVAIVETPHGPDEVMRRLSIIEQQFGRRRAAPNTPRTLDLDLIAHGRHLINSDGLIVPHPRAAQRRFVMGPLTEIAQTWVHPVLGVSASNLRSEAIIGTDAAPIE